MPKEAITLRLDARMHEMLRNESSLSGVSIASIIRGAVSEHLYISGAEESFLGCEVCGREARNTNLLGFRFCDEHFTYGRTEHQ